MKFRGRRAGPSDGVEDVVRFRSWLSVVENFQPFTGWEGRILWRCFLEDLSADWVYSYDRICRRGKGAEVLT